MRVLIVCINYNSYNELKKYLDSINKAAIGTYGITVDVIVADNSNGKECINTSHYDSFNLKIYNYENLGYFGGASAVINNLPRVEDYNYVAISNVDLLLSVDFFKILKETSLKDDVAWIAPQIYSVEENRDRNPKVMERYSKAQLKKLYYMYKFPILFYLYTATVYKLKKIAPRFGERDIYAGHGSFMLLTKCFFREYKRIDYPIFLYGEELFMAELIRNKGMKVHYVPSLRIEDKEHISTSKIKKKINIKYKRESIKYILDNFYE